MTTRRVLSSGERAATQGNRVSRYRLRVTNPDGAWLDLGALTVNGTPPKNFRQTATIAKSIDENTLQMTATVRREIGSLSLAPLRTDSALNANASFLYAPALDLRRRWAIDVSVLPWNTPASLDNYRPLAEGIITALDINGEVDVGTITVSGRGMEMALLKTDQLTEQQYVGAPILERLQAMLDRWNAGVTAVAHATAPSYFVNGTTPDSPQPKGPLMPALAEIAALPGAAFRYMYNASDVNELLLFTPDRNPSGPDWVLGPREYKAIPGNRLDLDSVANYVTLEYYDETLAQNVTITSPAPEPSTVTAVAGAATFSVSPGDTIADGAVIVVAGVPYTVSGYSGGTTATLSGAPTFAASEWVTSASITRYGLLPFELTLAQTTNVTTFAGASALADAIRADWELPALEQQIESEGAWFVELYDYLELLPNRTHYNESQYGGVVSVTHNFSGGKLMTTIGLRGKPAGGYRSWLSFGSNAPRVQPAPGVTNLTASWRNTLIGADAMIPGVFTAATVNQYARSVKFELSAALDFSTIINTVSVDVTDNTAEEGWVGSGYVTPGTDYYVRATPYSGLLSGGTPTGVAGEFVIANTRSLPKPTDTPSLTWDVSDPTKLQANVVLDETTLPPEVVGAAGAVYRVSIFDNPTEIEERWLTIGSALTEVSTKLRRRANLVGATAGRIVGTITEAAATFGCEVRFAYAPPGGSFTDIATGLSLYTAGPVASNWFDIDPAMAADIVLAVKTIGGDGTTSCALSSLALEVSVTGYETTPPDLGGFSDPFDTDGPMDSIWEPFNGISVNWNEYDIQGGKAVLNMNNNSLITTRGWVRADVPTDLVWTIEVPMDADTGGAQPWTAIALIMYESSSGKHLVFGVSNDSAGYTGYYVMANDETLAVVGTPISVGDWGTTTIRIRRNGPNMEFSYDRGSGFMTYGSFPIASHFTSMFDKYGFVTRNWTFNGPRSYYDIWNRIE